MKWRSLYAAIFAGFASCSVAARLPAAVSLTFTNVGSATTATTVVPGGTFNFSVNVVETTTSDKVTGADYQVRASTSGFIEFLGRNSSAGAFSEPNGFSDAYLNSSSYSPRVLNPLNGTDLGTSLADPAASVSGPGTSDLSDFTFKVLPGTPIGVYTLSFSGADYLGPPPSYDTNLLTPTAAFTVVVASSVPEPAGACLVAVVGGGLAVRRRR